ncbi:MAG: transposase [Saprospiraceae bacterium]
MNEKYKNKYRIASHRRPNWDYSADALYFLTIVTQHRKCNLGRIIHSDGHSFLQPSDFGQIVEYEWFKSFEIRDELLLHEFIMMTNHLHAIVEICNQNRAVPDGDVSNGNEPVETHGRVSLSIPNAPIDPNDSIDPNDPELSTIKRNAPIRLPQSISSFMAGFKSAVNTKIDDYIDEHQLNIPKYNRHNHFFQPNYHDHIIRDHREYVNIARYIIDNPAKWGIDKFHGK